MINKIKIDVSDKVNMFFSSDFHIGHSTLILQGERSFWSKNHEPDLDAMHETIIANWNKVVRKNDIVYYLGDLFFYDIEVAKSVVHRLNGRIHFIMGNHDKFSKIKKLGRFETIQDYLEVNIRGANEENLHLVLMHFPIYSWNRKKYGSYMVCGHSHHNLDDSQFFKENRIIDVGCNGFDYTPVSYKQIIDLKGGISPRREPIS